MGDAMASANLALLTDSYKFTHWRQYPPETEIVYSYFESRGGEYPDVVFFGLQGLIKRYLLQPITAADVAEARDFVRAHLGSAELFNLAGWTHVVEDHRGRLPVRIRAVPEGLPVPTLNVLMTVENTRPRCYWLTNYLETLLSQVWYPSTVATQSRECRRIITEFLAKTGDISLVPFKLHDFGFRGVSSVESAGVGGLAHLINFQGTDTVAALVYGSRYYHEPMAGFSVPAAEHSTITSWGRDHEVDAFRNMIDQYGSGAPGVYAVVSDSFNIFEACEKLWGEELHDRVITAENTLVVRPDSGDPPSTVVRVLELLGSKFGTTTNAKGYKVLHPKVRVIQGDGVDLQSIGAILQRMMDAGWSTDNLAFGMGGALLQRLNRDTLKFAFKCSAIRVGGKWRDVYKEPVTDPGKNSKRGRLKLVRERSELGRARLLTVRDGDPEFEGIPDLLQTVYEDGAILVDQTFAEVRERALPLAAAGGGVVAAA